jgi:hypothetical protein
MSTNNRIGLGIFLLLLLGEQMRAATGFYQAFMVIAAVAAFAFLINGDTQNSDKEQPE